VEWRLATTSMGHGGQEASITSFHLTLLHHGMIVVGMPLPYTCKHLSNMHEITGGTPYGGSDVQARSDELMQ
jgi:NAD(P)H dehydrogenase (quinone)